MIDIRKNKQQENSPKSYLDLKKDRQFLSPQEIIDIIQPAEVLINSINYLQYIDSGGNICECQKDYRARRWYKFTTIGRADSPREIFLSWID